MLSAKRKRMLAVSGLLWLSSALYGFASLYHYAAKPGEGAAALPAWPQDAQLPPPAGKPLLLLAAHPRCSCTLASVGQLNLLMGELRGRLDARVLAIRPHEFGPDWAETESIRQARRIPGARVLEDLDGREAAHFGAYTSGQVLLYSAEGRLLFKGGLTAFRGHMGDSLGYRRILALVRGGKADRAESAVFGCRLSDKVCPRSEGVEAGQQRFIKGGSRAKADS